jgi:glycosyltransferase involved in cell wall biosynthesis
MSSSPRASIVINNCNYGRFLREAIDSALSQTYSNHEVVVVDDGSTDNSREVLAGYAGRVVTVLKENGGQASAFNAGLRASRGDVIVFLDADDLLLPTALDRALARLEGTEAVKAHWPLWVIDERGRRTGGVVPEGILPEGDLRDRVVRQGPTNLLSPPTSGNAWSRPFLGAIFPMPEREYRIGADTYLFELAPFYGPLVSVPEPQGFYRCHGRNRYLSRTFADKLQQELGFFEHYCAVLTRYCKEQGWPVDPEVWRRNCWWHQLGRAVEEVAAVVPPGAPFILADGEAWGLDAELAGRPRLPLTERGGQYWGPPADDAEAIGECQRLHRAGARYLVVAWPAFWWLGHYAGWHRHLRGHAHCLVENERLLAFDLGPLPQ